MIHYALRCGAGHEFDGWFAGSASFDTQAQSGLLQCPVCADTSVARALMAPGVIGGAAPPPAPAERAAPPATMPDALRAVLARLRREVEQRCDYVGADFAAEARAIHEGERPERAIYGEASPDEVRALTEDGIEVGHIPWVKLADA